MKGATFLRKGERRTVLSSVEERRVKQQRRFLNDGAAGAAGELAASVALMSQGFDVFRALSPASPCDLIALRGSKLLRIEVRTGYRRADGSINWPRYKKDEGRSDFYSIYLSFENAIYFAPTEDTTALPTEKL